MMESIDSLRAKLEHTGFALVKTDGTSMRPLIWTGQHCVAVVLIEGEPKVGDLLAFINIVGGRKRGIIHRLVEIREESGETLYITRGDNCIGCEILHSSQIIGKVTEIHRLTAYRPWHAIPLRKFSTDGRAHRIYTRLWLMSWPLRRLLMLVCAKLRI